jgi:hypothetical protein
MTHDRGRIGWRVRVALVIFVASLAWPVLVPVLPLLGMSGAGVAAFAGAMAVAAEIMLVAGATLAGRNGFAFIKSRAFGFVKSFGPPDTVGRTRYTVGLVLFAMPLVFGWAAPYLGPRIPGFEGHPLVFAITGDVVLLASLFVLGGDFWDKLRALFVHGAHAVFP